MVPNDNSRSFYEQVLKSARHFLAPMVDQSELAWRILARKYGAQVTYTPMIHSRLFVENHQYRSQNMKFNDTDRPLIAQFCANDPQTFAKAVQLIQNDCDAIDLNLGCPQGIAKKGHYGAFLQDEWDLVSSILKEAVSIAKVPITAKCRIFEDVNKTIQYAKMLEATGIQLIVIHGRTREQKAQLTGLADWDQIKAVKNALSIPVIANGNIQYFEDIEKCINYTGVDGVMSAEGHLHNPAIFSPIKLNVYDAAKEYLEICKVYDTDRSSIRGHIFKLLQFSLITHNTYQSQISSAIKIEEFLNLLESMRSICESECQIVEWNPKLEAASIKEPHWICQPYERKSLEIIKEENQKDDLQLDIAAKRLEKKNRKRAAQKARIVAAKCGKIDMAHGRFKKLCVSCVSNNRSPDCQKAMCKSCCRSSQDCCTFHKT